MAAAAAVTGSLLLTVGCSSSNSSSGSTSGNTGSGTNWATASSVSAGGVTALVAAAKKEGTLNVITLPSNWANYAPHPAAARLCEEYLYSTTGQNLWLQGEARPIELSTLVKDGTVDQSAYMAPGASVEVSLPAQPVLVAPRRVS